MTLVRVNQVEFASAKLARLNSGRGTPRSLSEGTGPAPRLVRGQTPNAGGPRASCARHRVRSMAVSSRCLREVSLRRRTFSSSPSHTRERRAHARSSLYERPGSRGLPGASLATIRALFTRSFILVHPRPSSSILVHPRPFSSILVCARLLSSALVRARSLLFALVFSRFFLPFG